MGEFLFMARAVDNTLLHALNELAGKVSKATNATLAATCHLPNYVACNNRPRTTCGASDMILQIDSDAAFQVCDECKKPSWWLPVFDIQGWASLQCPCGSLGNLPSSNQSWEVLQKLKLVHHTSMDKQQSPSETALKNQGMNNLLPS